MEMKFLHFLAEHPEIVALSIATVLFIVLYIFITHYV